MKKLVQIVEDKNEGLNGLLGEYVVIYCVNYIYSGKLVGINKADIKLTEAEIVYDTGPLNAKKFTNSESLPTDWYIRISAIETYGKRGF